MVIRGYRLAPGGSRRDRGGGDGGSIRRIGHVHARVGTRSGRRKALGRETALLHKRRVEMNANSTTIPPFPEKIRDQGARDQSDYYATDGKTNDGVPNNA